MRDAAGPLEPQVAMTKPSGGSVSVSLLPRLRR